MSQHAVTTFSRDYAGLARRIAGVSGDRAARMRAVADACWDALHPTGVSWIGFYIADPVNPEQLLLAARRDKPACSPIGMHGACGRAYLAAAALVVRDVAALGADYIACDPRDRSEVVVPLVDEAGACNGVLDADSYDAGAFGAADAVGLLDVLHAAGLTSRASSQVPVTFA